MFESTDKHSTRVLKDPVKESLIQMAIPMILGIIAVLAINLVDTFWVAQLGAEELTAISFTFPVTFVVLSVLMGLGIGMSTAIAHATGKADHQEIERLTSQGILLSIITVICLALLGNFIITPLFTLMGAGGKVLHHIKNYLYIWFSGIAILAVPMVGNGAIRGLGDTTTPGLVMLTSALINAILDPLFIFGFGPIPKMGIQGAAISTIFAWIGALIFVVYILRSKLNIFRFRFDDPNGEWIKAWKKILHVGAPAALANLMTPLSAGIITTMVAQFGNTAVAGFGVGSRIEPIAMVVVMGLGSVLAPFMGQNWGAAQYKRARKALRISLRFSLAWMGLTFLFLYLTKQLIATLFSDDNNITETICAYLTIVPISYGGYAVTIIACSALNAVRRPIHAFLFSLIRLFILLIPFSYIGGKVGDVKGMFIGISLANIISGTISWFQARKIIRSAQDQAEKDMT